MYVSTSQNERLVLSVRSSSINPGLVQWARLTYARTFQIWWLWWPVLPPSLKIKSERNLKEGNSWEIWCKKPWIYIRLVSNDYDFVKSLHMCLQELTYLCFCYKFKWLKPWTTTTKPWTRLGTQYAQWYSLRSNFGALGLGRGRAAARCGGAGGSSQVWWCTPVHTPAGATPGSWQDCELQARGGCVLSNTCLKNQARRPQPWNSKETYGLKEKQFGWKWKQ